MDNQQTNKLGTLVRLLVGGVILSLLSFISDLSEIFSSPWFQKLITSNIFKWTPYILNILLSIFVIYLYRKSKSDYTKIKGSLYSTNKLLKSEGRFSHLLWKRYVRTLRAIVLDEIATPGIRDSLEPLLDELAKRLPDSGVNFKIGLVKPCLDGKFEFLADRGMDPASVHSMEQKANWKQKKSFFSNGLYLPDDKRYKKYASGETNYSNIQRDEGIGTSVSHFVVAIKAPVYSESKFPQNTLAVLSIGIPKAHDFDEGEEHAFYDRVFPFVKSIESILLNRIALERNQIKIK